jgi:AraC family ethanolamine operon transcriptional activator
MMPDPISGQRSWVLRSQFNDIDAQAAQFKGYGQQYQQLGPGPFEGRFCSFDFGADLSIHLEGANRALAQSASTPPRRYAACLLADTSPPCTLNGVTFGQDQVVVCPENKSLEGMTSEGMSIFCMDVSRDLLPDDGRHMRRAGVMKDAARSRYLRELLQSGLATFMSLESPAGYPAAARGFKSAVADSLWQLNAGVEDAAFSETRQYTTARALRVFRRARDNIHHSLPDGVSIVALCKETGVSRRSLESVFRSVIGMGPGNYIRALQLNHIRRDLMCASNAEVSIGAIAARHGIWHWSRFSHYYRLLFGELPSETRSYARLTERRHTVRKVRANS